MLVQMQSQMRGFFAALRMTSEEEAAAKTNAEVGWVPATANAEVGWRTVEVEKRISPLRCSR